MASCEEFDGVGNLAHWIHRPRAETSLFEEQALYCSGARTAVFGEIRISWLNRAGIQAARCGGIAQDSEGARGAERHRPLCNSCR